MFLVSNVGSPRKGYRSRLEIIRDILLVLVEEGSKKTHIMYGANLSYKLLLRYLEHILDAGLAKCTGNSYYTITEKGKKFLKLYQKYEEERVEVEKRLNCLHCGKEMLEKMLISEETE